MLAVLLNLFRPSPLGRPFLGAHQDFRQFLIADGLKHILHAVEPHSGLGIIEFIMTAQDDAFGVRAVSIHVFDQLQAVFPGHFNITHQNVDIGIAEYAHRVLIAPGCEDLVKAQLLPIDPVQDPLNSQFLVVHNQNIHARASFPASRSAESEKGMIRYTWVPPPTALEK